MIPFGTLSVMLKRAADTAVMDVVGPNGYLMSQDEANKLQKHMNKTKRYGSILDGSDPTTKNYNPAPQWKQPPAPPAPWSPGDKASLVDPATGPAYKPMSDQTYKVESQRYADRRLGNTMKGQQPQQYNPAPRPSTMIRSTHSVIPEAFMPNEQQPRKQPPVVPYRDLNTALKNTPPQAMPEGTWGKPQVMSTGEEVTVNPAADGTLDRTVTQTNRRGKLMTGTLHNATPGSFGSNNPNTINMLSKDNIAKFDAIKATGDAGRTAGRFDPHGLTNGSSFPSVAVPYGTYKGGGKNVFQGSVSKAPAMPTTAAKPAALPAGI